MRIDADRGRVAGIGQGRQTTIAAADGGGLIDGLSAVAGAVKRKENEAAAKEAERQELADRVTLAQAASAFRERMTQKFDEAGDAYDGSEPGFAAHFSETIAQDLDRELAGMDPRLQQKAALHFEGVAENFRLSALTLEDKARERHLLNGILDTVNSESLAVQKDASALPMARANIDLAISAAPKALQEDLRRENYAQLGEAALVNFETTRPAAGLKALEEGALDELVPADRQAMWRGRLLNEVERRNREAERQAEKASKVAGEFVKEEMKDISRLRDLGLPVSDERYDRLARYAAAAGGDAAQEVSEAREANRLAEEIRKVPLAQAASFTAQFRQKLAGQTDVSRADALQLEAAEKTFAGMKQRLAKDPLGFAAEARGGVDPLDFKDPVNALKSRAAQAREAAQHYGVKTRYFTDDELTALGAKLDESAETRRAFIDAAAAAGAPEMLAELASKQPAIAHLAGLKAMGGDPRFIADALEGGDLLRKEGKFPTTVNTSSGFAAAEEEKLFGSAFMLRPEAKLQAIRAARLAYDARSARTSRTREDFDEEAYRQALQEALGAVGEGRDMRGGVARLNRRDVWVPPYMRNDDFKPFWRSLTEAQFEAGGGAVYDADGRKIPLAQVKKGTPVAVANGVYQIDFGREGAPKWAAGKDGRPYRLDLNKIRQKELLATKGEKDGNEGTEE